MLYDALVLAVAVVSAKSVQFNLFYFSFYGNVFLIIYLKPDNKV